MSGLSPVGARRQGLARAGEGATLGGMAGRYRGNGEGMISKRKDSRWVARYYVRTAAGPKRRALYAGSRSEVATKLAAAIAERVLGEKPELAPDTHRRYTSIVEGQLSPALGSLVVADLGRAHVEHFLGRLRSEGLQPSTIRHVMAVLSAALNQADAWELLPSKPATNVRRPKDRTRKVRALSEEESGRLMAAARGTRCEVLYDVALTLGPRQGELRGSG